MKGTRMMIFIRTQLKQSEIVVEVDSVEEFHGFTHYAQLRRIISAIKLVSV